MRATPGLAEKLSASQAGPCSVEVVSGFVFRLGYLIFPFGYTTGMAPNKRAISTRRGEGQNWKQQAGVYFSLLCTPPEGTQGNRSIATVIIDLGECAATQSVHFTQWKRKSSSFWLGNLVGHKARLDVLNKRNISFHNRELNRGLPSPQPSHYVAKQKTESALTMNHRESWILMGILVYPISELVR
jgi:hypothetical protein